MDITVKFSSISNIPSNIPTIFHQLHKRLFMSGSYLWAVPKMMQYLPDKITVNSAAKCRLWSLIWTRGHLYKNLTLQCSSQNRMRQRETQREREPEEKQLMVVSHGSFISLAWLCYYCSGENVCPSGIQMPSGTKRRATTCDVFGL
ncbi:hypothetical protein HAX54_030978 [Datura stramonium]|uniref:Uncharacterized protein n=1 Tax=Datura stramonium TaxID=4076 RepID=A0ABS8V9G8_DATST|nr:hypothetical protein [Datura stramonium]